MFQQKDIAQNIFLLLHNGVMMRKQKMKIKNVLIIKENVLKVMNLVKIIIKMRIKKHVKILYLNIIIMLNVFTTIKIRNA